MPSVLLVLHLSWVTPVRWLFTQGPLWALFSSAASVLNEHVHLTLCMPPGHGKKSPKELCLQDWVRIWDHSRIKGRAFSMYSAFCFYRRRWVGYREQRLFLLSRHRSSACQHEMSVCLDHTDFKNCHLMAQGVKALAIQAWHPEFDPQVSTGSWKLSSGCCLCAVVYTHTHLHSQTCNR